MNFVSRTSHALGLLLAAAMLAPAGASAMPRLLQDQLRPPFLEAALGAAPSDAPAADGAAAPAPASPPAAGESQAALAPNDTPAPTTPAPAPAPEAKKPDLTPAPPSAPPGALDFNLLGDAPAPPPAADEGALRLRRTMLTLHQGLGFGLVALQLGTTVLGQLNYSDRFAHGPSTGRYETAHAVSAYATLGLFTGTALLALLAPKPIQRNDGFDRVTLHKISMFTAAAGMVAQGVLGIATREREGFTNQQSVATAHLVIGYVTLAAVVTGVSALVF